MPYYAYIPGSFKAEIDPSSILELEKIIYAIDDREFWKLIKSFKDLPPGEFYKEADHSPSEEKEAKDYLIMPIIQNKELELTKTQILGFRKRFKASTKEEAFKKITNPDFEKLWIRIFN